MVIFYYLKLGLWISGSCFCICNSLQAFKTWLALWIGLDVFTSASHAAAGKFVSSHSLTPLLRACPEVHCKQKQQDLKKMKIWSGSWVPWQIAYQHYHLKKLKKGINGQCHTCHRPSIMLVPPPSSVITEKLHQKQWNKCWSSSMCCVSHTLRGFPYM